MGCYLFNPHGREHPKLFGHNAFFDFETTGAQSNLHTRLRNGDTCVVLSYSSSTELLFRYFRLSAITLEQDPERGVLVRVLRGTELKEERMSKVVAIQGKHRDCFDKRGRLKQVSML